MFNVRSIIGVSVTVVIIWLGLSRIDLKELIAALRVARWDQVALGGILVVAAIGFFSIRWRLLLQGGEKVPLRLSFTYLSIGYMTNAILPLRPGDLVRAYLCGRRHGIAVSATLSSVVVERIFDVLTIVVIGFLVSALVELRHAVVMGLRVFALAGVAGFTFLFVLSFWSRWIEHIAWLNPGEHTFFWLTALFQRLEYFCQALTVLHDIPRLGLVSVLSFLGWGLLAAAMSSFIHALGIEVPTLAGALMMVVTNLGAVIPSAPGSLGVFHFLTVLALSIWQVPLSLAAAVAVLAHGVSIGIHIALGTLCAWLAGIRLIPLSRLTAPVSI
jgi:uncharacterized protein (TIRG00374 family)